jgi:hypothetical protein
MPKYQCKTIPLTKLIITEKGVHEPLCNSCTCVDCENPIEEKKISVFGVNKKAKVFMRRDTAHFVVECLEGYTR